jgi:hypothetical protein
MSKVLIAHAVEDMQTGCAGARCEWRISSPSRTASRILDPFTVYEEAARTGSTTASPHVEAVPDEGDVSRRRVV